MRKIPTFVTTFIIMMVFCLPAVMAGTHGYGDQTSIPLVKDTIGYDLYYDLFYFQNGSAVADDVGIWNRFMDMNATFFEDNVTGSTLFNHTYLDLGCFENQADIVTMQSYWYYFPTDYENNVNNITIFCHWGTLNGDVIENQTYVWFMNFSVYEDMTWIVPNSVNWNKTLIYSEDWTYSFATSHIYTILSNDYFDSPEEIQGMSFGLNESSVAGIQFVDFWSEYGVIGEMRNLLQDRAAVDQEFIPYMDIFFPGWNDITTTSTTSTTTTSPSGGSGNHAATTPTTTSAVIQPFAALGDNWWIYLLIGVAVIFLISNTLTTAGSSSVPVHRTKGPQKIRKPIRR